MPQQGARPAVGDQGGRGALLTPVGRLTFAGAGVIVGGMVVAAGTRMAWVTVLFGGTAVNDPKLPSVSLGGGEFPLRGADVGAGYLFGLGLLLALVPLGWLVVGPRGRVAIGLCGALLAVGIGVGVAVSRGGLTDYADELGVQLCGGRPACFFQTASDTGPGITAAGAAIAGVFSIGGASAGGRVPKLRMPEPPDKSATA